MQTALFRADYVVDSPRMSGCPAASTGSLSRPEGTARRTNLEVVACPNTADLVCKSLARASRSEAARGNGKEQPMSSILCARNRIGRSVIEAVLADFDRNGPDAVQTLRRARSGRIRQDAVRPLGRPRSPAGRGWETARRTRAAQPAPGALGWRKRSWRPWSRTSTLHGAGRHRHACGPRSRKPGRGS